MPIDVSTDNNIDGSETLATVIKGLVQQELAHLDEHISRIEVHLCDPSTGTTGDEENTACWKQGSRATIHGRQARGFDVGAATKGAASKVKCSLERILGKLYDRN